MSKLKFIDEEKYRDKTGIYEILNLKNGYSYIGVTKERFIRRFWHHASVLRNGHHSNQSLQADWNTYGESSFIFSVVEEVSPDLSDEREIFWIRKRREDGKCYNILDGGHENNLCRFIRPESRKRTGELNRLRITGSTLSDATKRKMSEVRTGKIVNRSTNILTPEIAFKIKTMFVQGYCSGEIMETLKVPYKPINMILSANTWASVYVDGWDDFQRNRPKGKGRPVAGHKKKRKTQQPC